MQDAELRALLSQFGTGEVAGDSVLSSAPDGLLRGWKTALDRASRRRLEPSIRTWVEEELRRLASEGATDEARARAGEVEAALRLSWIGAVNRIAEGRRPTCDFRVGAMNVEVYCPQEHVEERRAVEAELREQLKASTGPVKVATAICHPTTGSGRTVDEEGRVVRDPCSKALWFPANKLIDRAISAKRAATQFPSGEQNVLWLDLKHGLRLSAESCLPLRSVVAKGTCFVGMNGVWQAFYGRVGDLLFAERTALEYALCPGTYVQQRDGWFREVPKVSCTIVSALDGVVRLDNPWATDPLDPATSALLIRLSEFRPEFSWFDEQLRTLEINVEAERRRIAWVAQSQQEPPSG